MKTKIVIFAAVVSLVMAANAKQDDKVVLKTRKMVENSTPDDWKTLADAAKICIRKKSNLSQALEWLEKSLSIKTTAYNLELYGDYFAISNQPETAISYYVKALKAGLASDQYFNLNPLQAKIAALKNNNI